MARALMSTRMAFLLLAATVAAQQDTPRNPLLAFNRQPSEYREPMLYDLDMYERPPATLYRYVPPEMDQNDIGFMSPEEEYVSGELDYGNNKNEVLPDQVYPGDYMAKNRNKTFKKVLLDMLDDNEIDTPSEGIKKRVLSSFRERMESEKSKNQREKLAEQFLKKLENEAEERDAEIEYDVDREYIETLRDLLNKYKNSQGNTYPGPEYEPKVVMSEIMRKRQLPEYPPLGWSGIGYRKRESPANYALANEALYRSRDDEDDERPRSRRFEWIKANQPGYDAMDEPEPRSYYNPEYMYAKRKRNAVTKRSSNYYMSPATTHHKRFANKEQYRKKFAKKEHASGTDPKIVKDLKNIFGTKESNKTDSHLEKKLSENKKSDIKKAEVKKSSAKPEKITETTAMTTTTEHGGEKKKRTQGTEVNNHKKSDDEHLNIKKKSLDWSNYFGYDRRKKSRQNLNDIDDDWLMERYHKAFASATKKSTEYPLKYFRNHDELNKHDEDEEEGEKKKKSELQNTNESKLGEMDSKLKNIEDLIIDEALKYTGAHEGTTDSKEIQEIKDKVISRLAAAYSLEKMRRALGEFKTSIAAQRHAMKYSEGPDGQTDAQPETDARAEEKKRDKPDEKRTKSKKFQEEKKEDCRSENELDSEENQGPDLTNSVSGISDYEILERRCRSVARSVSAGEQSDFFYPLCKWHQICYLCSPDDSQESLTNCDVMFLSKAYVLCQGDLVCQWAARPAVEYLRDTYESTELSQSFDKSVCQADTPYNADYINHSGFKIRR